MRTAYREAYEGKEAEIIEKKSRFIATVRPVKTEEEAAAFIEEMKKKYWDATHNCYAFSVGTVNPTLRCSDDGEPGGTAGRPMMDVVTGEGVHNVCVVVTRYFGGTLLGTGGLVRAYSQAAKEGLKASVILEKKPGKKMKVVCDYNGIGKLQYLARQMELPILSSAYTDIVTSIVMVPDEQTGAFLKKITEATSGRAETEELDAVFFAEKDGEVLVFES